MKGINNNLIRFLIHLKNSSLSKRHHILVEKNKIIEETVRAMYREGLIQSYSTHEDKIVVQLRYVFGDCITSYLKVAQYPSKPNSLSYADIARLTFRRTQAFFTTNEGVLTLDECKRKKIGGYYLFNA